MSASADTAAARASGGVTGRIDEIQPGWISGWCADTALPGRRLELDLLVDGRVVARVLANRYRADLQAAGFGDGAHGFALTTPGLLFDGLEHRVELRELSTGRLLDGAAVAWQGARPLDVAMGFEGSALVGWAKMPAAAPARVRLEIVEDGRRICGASAVADPERPDLLRYRVPLPAECFDGRMRRFAVRGFEPSLALGELETVTPCLMSYDLQLRTGAPEPARPALQPLAALRYDALLRALERARAAGLPATDYAARLDMLLRAHALLARRPEDPLPEQPGFAFPRVEAPRVSVVIPVHDQFPVTLHCLASLLLAQNEATYEVILVDDGSSDATLRIGELVEGLVCLRNEEAQGFVRACNRGAAAARGEYLVLLNNDTEVSGRWLDELLWPFAHFERVGLAGAKLLYPDGSLQEAGGLVWNTGDPLNYGRHGNPHDPRYSYARQVDYASGACIMLPRALWCQLGGFDEQYCPAYFEDTDLAFRVREHGHRTVFAPLARVVHFEGLSSGTSTASGTKRFQEVNRPRFRERWVGAGACLHNGRPDESTDLHKDRGIAWRALVLDTETPRPDQSAGSHAAIQEIRMLQALGFKCTFLPANLAWMGRYTEELQRMGVECVYAPFTDSLEGFIEARGAEFDLVYVTRYHVAASCIDALRRHARRARIVLMLADLHFLRELRAARHAGDAAALAGAFRTRAAELEVMRRVDLTLSYTEEEREVIAAHGGDASRVAICPWVTEPAGAVPGFAARRDIAFLGGFVHPPNAEAVRWFVAEVMPLLRERLPGVRLRVCGSRLPRELAELGEQHADVLMEGWVADLRSVFDGCRVFVAPLQSGAGIKGKVIGAMAHGVPCVLSPLAAEGIPATHGVEVCVAASPREWVEAIVALHEDAARWEAMSAAALAAVALHFGFDAGVMRMRAALQQAGIHTATTSTALLAR